MEINFFYNHFRGVHECVVEVLDGFVSVRLCLVADEAELPEFAFFVEFE